MDGPRLPAAGIDLLACQYSQNWLHSPGYRQSFSTALSPCADDLLITRMPGPRTPQEIVVRQIDLICAPQMKSAEEANGHAERRFPRAGR